MNHWFRRAFSSVVFLFILYFNLPVFAQSPDDIKVHVSEEAAVPGHILDPGDYVFHRVNSAEPGVYSIVRMENHPAFIGYFQVTPSERSTHENSEVDYSSPDAAGVRLLEAWYAPGSTDGHRFIYTQRDMSKLDQIAAARRLEMDTAVGAP